MIWQAIEQRKQIPGLWILANELRGANIKYYSEIARSHKRVQHSVNASVKLDRLLQFLYKQKQDAGQNFMDDAHETAIQKLNFWCKMETAASSWLMGEQKIPITILRSLIGDDQGHLVNKEELPLVFSTLVSIFNIKGMGANNLGTMVF